MRASKPRRARPLRSSRTSGIFLIFRVLNCRFPLAKKYGVGRALDRRATRAAHFHGVVQLALGVDRFRGALELPETWEIGGPPRPRAHLSQSAYANRFRHPWRPSELVTAIQLEHSVSTRHPILQKIYLFLKLLCFMFKDSALALNQFKPDTTA
jgi:hypothetical protein